MNTQSWIGLCMDFDIKINNIPVKMEVKTVGPASFEDIDKFREKIESGKLVLVEKETKDEGNPYFVQSINTDVVSEEKNDEQFPNKIESLPQCSSVDMEESIVQTNWAEPTTEPTTEYEEIADLPHKQNLEQEPSVVDKSNILSTIEDIQEIFEENKDPEVQKGMKPWWKSKTVISNVLAALGCVLGVIASDDPQSSMYLPATVVAFINLYLRSITKNEIKLPM